MRLAALTRVSPEPAHRASHFAPWHRRYLYSVGALLLLTGIGWLALHYSVAGGADELPHPIVTWVIRLHGLAAEAALFGFGIVAAVHLPHGWRASRRPRWVHQRPTGLLLCALALLVSLSGYLLYYFAPEWLRPSLGWGHSAVGSALVLGIAWHRRGARRRGRG